MRERLEKLDRGELDPFELDELIHRYKRSAQKLWSFCGSSGSAWQQAASEHREQANSTSIDSTSRPWRASVLVFNAERLLGGLAVSLGGGGWLVIVTTVLTILESVSLWIGS